MSPIQFIKDYGVDAARIVIGSAEIGEIQTPNVRDLKLLVESVEIISGFGSVALVEAAIRKYEDKNKFFISFKSKEKSPEGWSIYFPVSIRRARKAIADYQAIYS